jgi:hypothetical protein
MLFCGHVCYLFGNLVSFRPSCLLNLTLLSKRTFRMQAAMKRKCEAHSYSPRMKAAVVASR